MRYYRMRGFKRYIWRNSNGAQRQQMRDDGFYPSNRPSASPQKYQQNYHDYDKHPSSSSMAKVLLGIIIGLLLVGLIYMLIWTAQQGI